MRVRKGRVGQPRGGEGRGVDACMEVDGRLWGEEGKYIYIKKDINMGRLYNYYQRLCYMIYACLCVFAQKAVPYFILLGSSSWMTSALWTVSVLMVRLYTEGFLT